MKKNQNPQILNAQQQMNKHNNMMQEQQDQLDNCYQDEEMEEDDCVDDDEEDKSSNGEERIDENQIYNDAGDDDICGYQNQDHMMMANNENGYMQEMSQKQKQQQQLQPTGIFRFDLHELI